MHSTSPNPFDRQALGPEVLRIWQDLVDLLAAALTVPAALIMRVDGPRIEVFVSSRTADNPYRVGDNEPYAGSGLYCEWVVKEESCLEVPDARADPKWSANPDVRLGMVSYLGLPIRRPDRGVFGTVCVLDRDHKVHPELAKAKLDKFRLLVESHLALVRAREEIREKERELATLHKVLPVCSYCRSIRDANGHWIPLDRYLHQHNGVPPSHGICPECLSEHFPEEAAEEAVESRAGGGGYP